MDNEEEMSSDILNRSLEGIRELFGSRDLASPAILSKLLWRAVQFSDDSKIKIICILLDAATGYDAKSICYRDCEGTTPLHIAAKNRHIETLKMLLEFGFDVNVMDNHKQTPLFYVIKQTTLQIGMILNKDQVNPDELLDVERECIEIIKVLLEYGALTNIRDRSDKAILCYVASCETASNYNAMEKTAKLLLRHGATVCNPCTDNVCDMPICIALSYDNRGLAKLFLEYDPVTFCRERDRMLLQMAAQKGYHEFFEILLNLGADIDSMDINGLTTLHFACGSESKELVTSLLQYGCDVDRISSGKFKKRAIDFADGEVTEIISSYTWKLLAAGFQPYIHEWKLGVYDVDLLMIFPDLLTDNASSTDLTEQCRKELEVMKVEKIRHTNISFHDVLTDDKDELAVYAKNENVVLFLNSDECKGKFPMYADVLKGLIWRGIVRRNLLRKCIEVFLIFHDGLPILPDLCVERILRYLSDTELRSFVQRFHSKQRGDALLKVLVDREEDLKEYEL